MNRIFMYFNSVVYWFSILIKNNQYNCTNSLVLGNKSMNFNIS